MSYWKKKCKHCPIKIHAPQYWKADMESSKRFALYSFFPVHETLTYFFYLICWRRGTRSRRRSAKCIIEHWISITNLALILFQILILWNFWANPVKLRKILNCPFSKGCRSKQKENHWLRKGMYFTLNYLFLFRKQGGKGNSSKPGDITDSLAHSLP